MTNDIFVFSKLVAQRRQTKARTLNLLYRHIFSPGTFKFTSVFMEQTEFHTAMKS